MTEWETDLRESEWLSERIHGFARDVGSVVPRGLESYARIFHPLEGLDVSHWRDLAERNGRVAHAEMQYHLIAAPPGEQAHPHEHLQHMAIGSMRAKELRLLVDVLHRHTAFEEQCFFAVWEGFAQLHGGPSVAVMTANGAFHPPGIAPQEALDRPRIELPSRSYLLLSGLLTEVPELQTSLQGQSPNIWWPKGRAWCVATEIDFGWTYVGGAESLIEDLVATQGLEALRCRLSDGVTLSSDVLNAGPGSKDS